MRPSPPGYLIERELARGGMGVVFLAHQVGLNRPVAIKMLLADRHATTDDLTRFELEIHAVARLQHPNIVRIFDVGWYDGLPFCALEYLPGQSLAARLHGQPVAPRRAAELLAVLARAVHAAHESGIVHRDLKPANVLFATDADPWRPEDARLTDFGIAKLADIGPVTATDSVLGTPAYMAPEQAGGRSREVTSRSDVYSLGAILYEVITGRPPFTGTDALEVLPQVLNDEPVRPSRLAPGLPRDLETICLRCLHKDPTRRYASAADLAADLDRFLDGRPVAARPVGTAEVAARWCRRNPVVAALGAALGLAVAIGLGGVGWQWREAVRAGVAREQQAGQAIEARALAERHLTISRVAQAALLWEQSDIPATLKLLEQCPPSHRGWEWYHLRGLCRAHLGGVELPAWGWTVAVHPDGRSAAVVCGWPSGGSQERTVIRCRLPGLVPGPESAGGHVHPVRLAYTPRGRLATLDGAGTARHLDPETMAVIWQQPAPKGTHGAWMSSDGRWIARATTDHRLWLYDADAGRLGPVLAGHPRPIHQIVFSADGRTAASSDAGEELRGWDLEAGRQMFRREGGGTWPRFAPDGQRLAVTVRASELHLLEARTGAVLWRTGGGRHLAYDLAGQPIFSPDGRWVAVNSTGQAPRVWDVATGRGGHPLRGHEGVAYAVRSIQFSPDGRYVATTGSDRTVRLWDPASGDPMALYRGHVAPVEHAAFSPDGRQLLTVSGGPAANSLITWDLSRGQKAWRERRFTRFFARAEYSSLLAFRPNGALVAGYAPFGLASWDESGTRIEDWPLNAAQNRWIEWHAMALSSGGRYAAVRRGADDEVVHFDLETHERRQWAVGEPVRTVAVSPDGRHVAAGTRVGQILVWDAVAGRVVTSVDVGPILRLAFSPDGQTIAVGGFGVSLVDVTHGTIHRLHSGAEEGAVVGLAFDPNGHRLATTVERPGEVRVYDLKEGQLERRWPEPRTLGDVAYHPSGERIAVASREGMVTIYDPRTGLEVLTLRGLTGRQMDLAYPPRVAFSPDGQRLACNDHATGLWVWDADPDLAERRARADAAAWAHHQRAADDTQEGDLGFALDFHLQRLNATDPPSRHQQLKRAELRSRAGEWAGAAADYRAWLGSRPTEGWEEVVARLAMAEALAGQGDAGRRLWPLPGSGPGRFHLERAALTMQAVTPSEGLHVALCLLASSQTPEVRALVGLAQVRAGHRDAARTTLLPLVRPVVPCPRAAANASLGLAMLEAAEGRSESARGLIREAERWAQSGDGLSRITNMDPGTWPVYRLLHREACRVVGGGDDRTGRRGTGGTASVR